MTIAPQSLSLVVLHASIACDYGLFWKHFLSKGVENCAFCIHNTTSHGYIEAVLSDSELYKYEWILDKKTHCEYISVFYKKMPTYNPQMTQGKAYRCVRPANSTVNIAPALNKKHVTVCDGERYPFSVLQNKIDDSYFVRTYSNVGDKVLIVNERENKFKCKAFTHGKVLTHGNSR